jgi:hypothetical protein
MSGIIAGFFLFAFFTATSFAAALDDYFHPPLEIGRDFGKYSSLLKFSDGSLVSTPKDWQRRRLEISTYWLSTIGSWPPLLNEPRMKVLSSTNRENFIQKKVEIETAHDFFQTGYLLLPKQPLPCPAVFIPYYEPESSGGLGRVELRDFGYQLARRGYVTLSIGSPGGDAWKPPSGETQCQPLCFLAYIAANCAQALSRLPEVDPNRIGIVGHSYGGKWAMFGMALSEKFACGVWSDPGIVFDETRSNVNYWEPWYLGKDPGRTRKPGIPTEGNPRTGAYKKLFEDGHDLHELLALLAPRPFLVSGGSEDPVERWNALNRVNEVYNLLGMSNRIALTSRKHHDPTAESNEQIYEFFNRFLKAAQ